MSHMTTVKLPAVIHQKLIKAVVDDGFGMRGKSRWVENALEDFIQLSDYPSMVDIAEEIGHQNNQIMSLRLSDLLVQALDQAVVNVRKTYPSMEGVRSNIIRASILQKLLRYP